jgi:hypothetical protein
VANASAASPASPKSIDRIVGVTFPASSIFCSSTASSLRLRKIASDIAELLGSLKQPPLAAVPLLAAGDDVQAVPA